jgi:hypothetical protein
MSDNPAPRPLEPPETAFGVLAPPLGERRRAFLDPGANLVEAYSGTTQLILFPSLVAASARAQTFAGWRNPDHDLGAVEMSYVDDTGVDAYAFREEAVHAIALHQGLALGLLDIACMVFAHPGCFREIGDPNRESLARLKTRTRTPGFAFIRAKAAPFEDEAEFTFPDCPVRRDGALYLTNLCVDLIWAHELGHSVLGHVGYAQSKLGIRALHEAPNPESKADLQPLEAQADIFAARGVVHMAHAGPSPYLPKSLETLPQPGRVKLAVFAAAILSRFWSLHQGVDLKLDGEDPYEAGSHPPPFVRLHLGFEAASTKLQELGVPARAAKIIVFEVLSELEPLSRSAKWFSNLDPKILIDADRMQAVRRHIGELKRLGHELDRDLEGFRFTPDHPQKAR